MWGGRGRWGGRGEGGRCWEDYSRAFLSSTPPHTCGVSYGAWYPYHSGTLPDGCKLAVFDHVTSNTAMLLPVAALIDLCRSRGVEVGLASCRLIVL